MLKVTQFRPLLDGFFRTDTATSLAGGGAERTVAGLDATLAETRSRRRRCG